MSQLDRILSLHSTVVELREARRLLEGVPDWMAELHQEYGERKAEIDAEEEAAAQADRLRRVAEAEVADVEERLRKYQGQISQVTTQREYGALLKEIDTAKGQIKDAEERAITALEEQEEAGGRLDELRHAFTDLDQRYKTELAKWEVEKPSVASRVESLTTRVDELRGQMPGGLLSLFDRLYRSTDGDAVARVLRLETGRGGAMWHCRACHYNVRPQLLVAIRGGELEQCESCKRILYWSDEGAE